ncbi:MAG: M28 family peptidase, partial [Candidatus Sericytochromatia bacterium]
MEVARKFSIIKNNKRTIAFMAFSGEELGLVGSSYFNNKPIFGKNKKIVSMINMDMVGRLEDEKLTIGGVKTAPGFKKLVNDINGKYDFKLSYFDDGFGPSDHMAFYLKGIPVLFFFTGVHDDYHKPSDDHFKINYPGLNKITDYVTEIAFAIDKNKEKPQYVKMNPPSNMNMLSTGKSSGAYIGAIPDYSSMNSNESGGVKISGVRDGSPADKAGVKANDVIIKFDGTKINGIYDYTYAIKSKKPDDKVEMVVLREGKEVVLQVVVGKKQ